MWALQWAVFTMCGISLAEQAANHLNIFFSFSTKKEEEDEGGWRVSRSCLFPFPSIPFSILNLTLVLISPENRRRRLQDTRKACAKFKLPVLFSCTDFLYFYLLNLKIIAHRPRNRKKKERKKRHFIS